MPRTRSIAWAELKLGIVGVVALVLLIVIVLALGGEAGFSWQRYPLKTRFRDAAGLQEGAVVRLSGKEVGTVKSVEFSGAELDVVLEVREEVRKLITTESVATIGSLSLLGESMVEIRASTTGSPLDDWAYVRSGTGSGLGDLQNKVSTSLENVDQMIADLRAGRGTMGKLLTDDAVYQELEQFVASAAAVTRDLNQGKGTLGALAKDPAAYQALKTSLENLQSMTGANQQRAGLARPAPERRIDGEVAHEHHRQPRSDHGEAQERRGHGGTAPHRSRTLRSPQQHDQARRRHRRQPQRGAGDGGSAAAGSGAL